MSAGVFCVPNLGYVALIIHATLDGAGVSTLGGAVSPELLSGDVFTTLGGEPGLFMLD